MMKITIVTGDEHKYSIRTSKKGASQADIYEAITTLEEIKLYLLVKLREKSMLIEKK